MFQNKKLAIIGSVFFSLIIVVCGVYFYFKIKDNNQISKNSRGEFTVPEIPSGWNVATSSNFGSLTIMSLNQASSSDPFLDTDPLIFVVNRKILSPSIDPVAKAASLDEYANSVKGNFVPFFLASYIQNYKLIEDQSIVLNDGIKGHIIGTSFDVVPPTKDSTQKSATTSKTKTASTTVRSSSSLPAPTKTLHFRTLNLLVANAGKMYILTAKADISEWDKYSQEFMRIISGFKLQ